MRAIPDVELSHSPATQQKGGRTLAGKLIGLQDTSLQSVLRAYHGDFERMDTDQFKPIALPVLHHNQHRNSTGERRRLT